MIAFILMMITYYTLQNILINNAVGNIDKVIDSYFVERNKETYSAVKKREDIKSKTLSTDTQKLKQISESTETKRELKELVAEELEVDLKKLNDEELKEMLSDKYDDEFFEQYFKTYHERELTEEEEIVLANHMLKEFTAKKILVERELERLKEEL